MKSETPSTYDEAAELLRGATADGRPVRFRGGGTKLGWGRPVPEPDLEICTEGLDRILEHNAGDFTAVLQAGVPLAVAEGAFAASQLDETFQIEAWGEDAEAAQRRQALAADLKAASRFLDLLG